jgi:hypothetical protein
MFFVINVSYTSSITQYHESSVAFSTEGLRTQLVLGIQTTGATAVPLVVSFQSQIADFLQINGSAVIYGIIKD